MYKNEILNSDCDVRKNAAGNPKFKEVFNR
jgi:hypothetical protein